MRIPPFTIRDLRLTYSRLDAIRKAREWVLTTSLAQAQLRRDLGSIVATPPKHNIEDLLGIISPDVRLPLDMMEVILRIVDDSRIEQFKPLFGKNIITAWAYIHGKSSSFDPD